jgi:hypothetical protein
VSEARLQAGPGFRFAVGQLVDAEPGEVGTAQAFEVVERPKNDLRAVVQERDPVFALVRDVGDFLKFEDFEERPFGRIAQQRVGRCADQPEQSGIPAISLEESFIAEGERFPRANWSRETLEGVIEVVVEALGARQRLVFPGPAGYIVQ